MKQNQNEYIFIISLKPYCYFRFLYKKKVDFENKKL